MEQCSTCGKELTYLEALKCSFCGEKFCSEHLLAENHNCTKLPKKAALGQWKAKPEFNDYVKTTSTGRVVRVPQKKQGTVLEKFKDLFRR